MGLAVFILAHTKNKDKTDALTGEKFEMLTNNLRADYYSPVADSCQMIVNIAIEREINEGVQVGEKRMMFFRNNGLVDCGSRFTDLPDKLELSAENFMEAFKQGVKGSMRKKVSDDELKQIKEKEIKETKEEGKKIVEELLENEKEETQVQEVESTTKIIDEIKSKLTKENKPLMIEYLKSKGKKINELNVDELNEVLAKLN